MKPQRLLCNAAGVLVPAAASFYVALRVNIAIMAFFADFVPQSVAEEYRVRLVDVVTLILLLMGWLVLTIWLHYRVSGASSCRAGLRAAAQHLGITLLVFGVSDALFRVALPGVPTGAVAIVVAAVAWVGGLALVWFGYRPRAGQVSWRREE
ncbi:MAG: hypothetical protein ACOCW3_03785 [Spirochaetota bacterium]